MKIAIYSPYLETMTGGEKYIFTMASCLSIDHDVTIFWDDKEILEKATLKFGINLSKVKIRPDVFKTGNFLNRYLKTYPFDRLIYLSDGSIPFVGSRRLFIHFQFPAEWVDTSSLKIKLKMNFVSKIICNSNYTKEFIDRKFNTKSFVLYPPADIAKNPKKDKKNIILTVGRFNRLTSGSDFKKLEVMVDAFKEFQKKRLKAWEFVIVTSVRKEEEIEFEKFKSKIKSKSIKIYKNASYEEVTNFYSQAKIYWHAAGYGEDLMKRPELAEHFGISTVEAMSFGAVPIVINAGGQKEIVKQNENGYLWNSVEELVALTHKIAVDNKLRIRLSEQAIEDSKIFSKERFCQDLNHLIW